MIWRQREPITANRIYMKTKTGNNGYTGRLYGDCCERLFENKTHTKNTHTKHTRTHTHMSKHLHKNTHTQTNTHTHIHTLAQTNTTTHAANDTDHPLPRRPSRQTIFFLSGHHTDRPPDKVTPPFTALAKTDSSKSECTTSRAGQKGQIHQANTLNWKEAL